MYVAPAEADENVAAAAVSKTCQSSRARRPPSKYLEQTKEPTAKSKEAKSTNPPIAKPSNKFKQIAKPPKSEKKSPTDDDEIACVAQARVERQQENSHKKGNNKIKENVKTKKPKEGIVSSKKKGKVECARGDDEPDPPEDITAKESKKRKSLPNKHRWLSNKHRMPSFSDFLNSHDDSDAEEVFISK